MTDRKIPLKVVIAPAVGVVLEAPPVLKAISGLSRRRSRVRAPSLPPVFPRQTFESLMRAPMAELA
jgi:hypothetical protein